MIHKYKRLVLKTQNTILSAALILAMANGVNAILGFVKSRLLVTYFGDSTELAVFYTADRIPNLLYSVLVVGALATVFIPVFTTIYKKDKERAWSTASTMINFTMVLFFIIGSLIFIAAPQLMRLLSIGKFGEYEIYLGTGLMRVMVLAQLVLVGSSFVTSVLQSFRYFFIPALAPIAYSIGFILGIIFLSPNFGIFGPALGVIIGAVLHLCIQLPLMKQVKYRLTFSFNFYKNGTTEMFKLMPARIGSVLINSLTATISNSLAILVSTSAVVHLKFANQLQFFPVYLVGFSLAHASLPTLSEEGDNKNLGKFKRTFITSLHQMMFLVIPASMILFILRVPMVRIVFGATTFSWEATIKTSYALAFFALSIFAQSGIYLVTRAFYALKDTATPVKLSALTIIIDVALSLLFVWYFKLGVWSIAFSFSITSILYFLSLFIFFIKKIDGLGKSELLIPITKISYAALFMGIFLYLPLKLLDQFVFDTTRTIPLIVLTVVTGVVGTVVYLLLTWLFKVEEVELLYKLVRRLKFKKGTNLIATTTIGTREEIR